MSMGCDRDLTDLPMAQAGDLTHFNGEGRACMTYTNRKSETRRGDFDREIREIARAADRRIH